jgi:hypothetical protein
MYAQVQKGGARSYFIDAADSIRCGTQPADRGVSLFHVHGLGQYLSLTQARTIWAIWPGAPTTNDAPAD